MFTSDDLVQCVNIWQRLAVCMMWLYLSLTPLVTLAAPPYPSVMSTNLCADLLLLRLADPTQIRSVSRQSQDVRVSPVTEQARRYPANRGAVEDLLYFKPDIALVYPGWMGQRHTERLAAQGMRVIAVPYTKTWDAALDTARTIAAQIGRAEFGAALVADFAQRMQALARPTAVTTAPSLLYLRPNGGTAGRDTYIDDLITRLGWRNLATEQGISGWGRFPLERLVRTPPDVLLLGYFDQAQSPTRTAYGRHPRLRALLERTAWIGLSGQAWGCGGLEVLDIAERLSTQLPQLEPRRSQIPSP